MRGSSVTTIRQPPDDLYRHWRDFANLPTFMDHVRSVEVIDDRRSHWVVNAPAGATVEWDAEITEDEPGTVIAWRSTSGADVENSGSVRFSPAPGDRGTEVRVEVEYSPPGGMIGEVIAKIFGEAPDQQIADDLRRFKQVMETGEVVRSGGNPDGTRTLRQVNQDAAQPPGDEGTK
jgi:uncharacterized membrane protein